MSFHCVIFNFFLLSLLFRLCVKILQNWGVRKMAVISSKIINNELQLQDIQSIVEGKVGIEMSQESRNAIDECFSFLESFSKDKVIYGINTGFGPMAQWRIDDAHLNELQYNIIRSHSTGAGEPLPEKCVRAAMLARLMTFMQAHSGVNIQTCELLIEFLNRGIYPVIPQHGSVGASGDLVQLAHIALALIGEGEVFYKGERRNTSESLWFLYIVEVPPCGWGWMSGLSRFLG
jgi:histidine ammonia-lyase